ncbi:pentapeptide repeat-containing protein [Halocatena pleomorpha]|nr:pentapeptide repeat-containing protein [Halocatena pleomorpha]
MSFRRCTLHGASFEMSEMRGVDFTDANLRWADFTDATSIGADFTDATPIGAAFTNADLRWTDFRDTDLATADFTDADLQGAKLSEANAREVSFQHATLQDAVLMRADCRGADFTDALLYETVFADTRINSTTTFYDPAETRPICIYEKDPTTAEKLPEDISPLEAAHWVYRRLESLHEENALSEVAREFHISKEEAERALYKDRGRYGPWAVKTLMWYLTKHGESVKRVLIWWGIVILTAGLLFAGLGGVKDATGTNYAITSLSQLRTVTGWQDILMNIYFSVTTFSTIMDGGLAPAGIGTRAIVAVESITGALLVALLVFVLGRRTAR